jgi:Phosphotransferase enzyme family
MDTADVSALFRQLAGAAHLDGAIREPIRVWDRSGVERLRLSGGTSVVFKYAEAPFDAEDTILAALAARGLPVPAVYCAAHRGDILGMLLEDLGPEQRAAEDDDGAAAAVTLHAAGEIPGLPRLGQDDPAGLPARSLTAARHHWPDAAGIHDMLQSLATAASARAQGAGTAPSGLCHSEFHPTSVHIGAGNQMRMLDFARAFNGPGLLDLASWPGTTGDPDPGRVEGLLHHYVAAGGTRHVLRERGGLPAADWALGWHRVWAAAWFIDRAPAWAAGPEADQAWRTAIGRHLAEAVTLLKT